MSFQVTQAAAEYIHDYIQKHNEPGSLRIFLEDVKNCGDKTLKFSTMAEVDEHDTVVATLFDDVRVVADLIHNPAFIGATLDLEVKGLSRRLVVRSEQMSSCGCGLSLTIKK